MDVKQHLTRKNKFSELRSCVKVEVDTRDYQVSTVSVDVKQHRKRTSANRHRRTLKDGPVLEAGRIVLLLSCSQRLVLWALTLFPTAVQRASLRTTRVLAGSLPPVTLFPTAVQRASLWATQLLAGSLPP